jgi:hypothetical protein
MATSHSTPTISRDGSMSVSTTAPSFDPLQYAKGPAMAPRMAAMT